MNRRTSACDLKRVANGLAAMTTISAMDLPGVLLQAGIALGNHNSKKLPRSTTCRAQRCIYYFFALQRFRNRRKREGKMTEGDVQVGGGNCRISVKYLFFQHFEMQIQQFLLSMKQAFSKFSKSSFRFHKFHMILHAPLQVRQFGNLDVMDANR